jgi:repressor of nif and glnA expression
VSATSYAREHYSKALRVVAMSDDPLAAKEAARLVDAIGTDSVREILKHLQSTGLARAEGTRPTRYTADREFIEKRICGPHCNNLKLHMPSRT